VEKVREFYHRELPHWIISTKRHGSVQMEYTEDGFKRIIAIHDQDGETRIGLASMGEPAAN
jgi:YD repeat-containing protein